MEVRECFWCTAKFVPDMDLYDSSFCSVECSDLYEDWAEDEQLLEQEFLGIMHYSYGYDDLKTCYKIIYEHLTGEG